MTNEAEKQDIKNLFWENVEWHMENKNMTWVTAFGTHASNYRGKQRNVSLNKVQEIAAILDIDDYAILFEEVPTTFEVSK